MGNTQKNQEIVARFLASKAFSFEAFGKFVAENGASIASSADGDFGFVIGNRFLRYCIPPASLWEEVDQLEARGEVTGD